MKLTALELAVILDTLRGSLALSEGGRLFAYTQKTREDVLNRIAGIMQKATIELDDVGKNSE